MDNGLVHIYCGNGKGKTTAAMGLALRTAGCGLNVIVAQFLKSSTTSERKCLEKLENITLLSIPEDTKFVWNMTDSEFDNTKSIFQELFNKCVDLSCSENTDVIVMDEIFATVSNGIVTNEMLCDLIRNRNSGVELVLTGRNPDSSIMELADYVTEMTLIKHPFQQGIAAREGIEY